jgi:hypothetical protein
MRTIALRALIIVALVAAAGAVAVDAADDSKVKAATRQVESGAKQLGEGKIGDGVEETAKGIGKTVAEGAKFTGEKLKEAGKSAEPEAKSAWKNVKEGANSFGASVKHFFTRLFNR